MVLSTGKLQSQVREQWNKSRKIQNTVHSENELTCNIAFDGVSYSKGVFFAGSVNSLVPRTRRRLEY